ncbi:TetR/AcrR family transcriptional regulator [Tsukamurella tyrosinosolvens]|uniref:TetR/AcrR family transcriptional regulator n=1 Tax=Tsukamurella tyrosinosolvens TaxID=57704 RepID=UPI00079B57C6|nr:TetR/AcrR family transcriptional regulator [Tsukamurella tyrosinosolvens]KXP02603.1 TetR family transcriptional regulator [Tsukamurella tyrosinosolvens]KZL96741.1 TetR family transcriptional regulator [Tsukamurella tyrosinosolvens]MCA4996654.1 TetR/AcrR family transcriptional regulator [Tsukamurella tyrosinosolvens]
MDSNVEAPRTRRRGAALEAAILDAAWDQLTDGGYGDFTLEAVAARAGTSRSVLYRRWPGRVELLRAALAHRGDTLAAHPSDTGTLRGDAIALLRAMSDHRVELMILLQTRLGEFFAESGDSPADLRELMVGPRGGSMHDAVARAVERGEINPARVTDRIVRLPADLVRHQMAMTLRPVPIEDITEIVDDCFLPLLAPREPREGT